jgi:crotonobetainyl-CoA:carnitine CoA-transferase CaiB-like acyl-CoA transferase
MLPLEGLTVVTLEHAIAGPFATRQLAGLGARVIKVERPGSGDFARGYDHRVRGLASHFVWTNRSKESITLDVKHPDGAAALRRLVLEKADVVVQNLAPGRSPGSSSATSPATARTARTATRRPTTCSSRARPGSCR